MADFQPQPLTTVDMWLTILSPYYPLDSVTLERVFNSNSTANNRTLLVAVNELNMRELARKVKAS